MAKGEVVERGASMVLKTSQRRSMVEGGHDDLGGLGGLGEGGRQAWGSVTAKQNIFPQCHMQPLSHCVGRHPCRGRPRGCTLFGLDMDLNLDLELNLGVNFDL